MPGPFSHLQQSHIQHHSAHTSGSAGIPPPSLAAHPSFVPGSSNPSQNPFTLASGNNGLSGAGGLGGGGGSGLASHAAQMGFAHGAALQQRQAEDAMGRISADGRGPTKGRIRDVWRGNLAQEMHVLRGLVERFPYISMVGCDILKASPLLGSSLCSYSAARIRSFLALSRDQWAPLPPKRIIIIKPCAATWTF